MFSFLAFLLGRDVDESKVFNKHLLPGSNQHVVDLVS
jgi:hypothetical protein